jgi:hypothetical protein
MLLDPDDKQFLPNFDITLKYISVNAVNSGTTKLAETSEMEDTFITINSERGSGQKFTGLRALDKGPRTAD